MTEEVQDIENVLTADEVEVMESGSEESADGQVGLRLAVPVGTLMAHLLKGPVYRSGNNMIYGNILRLQNRLNGEFAPLGLKLELDDAEGYAYLKSRSADEYPDDIKASQRPPQLLPRVQLPLLDSFLLTWFRLKVSESDAAGEPRCIMTFEEIVSGLLPYFKQEKDEGALRRSISGSLKKLAGLGFVHRLDDKGERIEILRIIKALFTAQAINGLRKNLEERLENYAEYAQKRAAERAER